MNLDPKKASTAGASAGKAVNTGAKVAANAAKQVSVFAAHLVFSFAKSVLGKE